MYFAPNKAPAKPAKEPAIMNTIKISFCTFTPINEVASKSKDAPRIARPARDFLINNSTAIRAIILTTKIIKSICPTLAPKILILSLEKFIG